MSCCIILNYYNPEKKLENKKNASKLGITGGPGRVRICIRSYDWDVYTRIQVIRCPNRSQWANTFMLPVLYMQPLLKQKNGTSIC